jgi:WD40 repeat protein
MAVVFSPDGKWLAGGGGKCLVIWDVATGKPMRALREEGVRGFGTAAFTPDGDTLFTGSDLARRWDVASGRETGAGRADVEYSKERSIGYITIAVSPNGKTFAAGDWFGSNGVGGKVSVFETATMRFLGDLQGYEKKKLLSTTYSSDGSLLATGDDGGGVKLWDLASAAEKHRFSRESGSVNVVRFNPDGTVLASGSGEGTITLREVSSGKDLRTLKPNEAVYAVAFSKDGKTLFSGGLNGTISAWNVSSGDIVRHLPESSGLIVK